MQAIRDDGQPGLQQQPLGELLVHRERAAQDVGADVGHAAGLEESLEGAVFAERAVQCGKGDGYAW